MPSILIASLLVLFFSAPKVEPAATGSIEGRVTVKSVPARVANRYPGAGGGAARDLEQLPVLVFIEGAIAGATPKPVPAPQMAQRDTSFKPATLVIPVGASVRFLNEDRFFHNVFSYSKTRRFDLGRYPKGESKSVTFEQPGTVGVFCEIHKWMRGAILVVENPYHTTVAADGSFRIPDVPAGSYKVSVWHAERGKKTFDVTVPATGAARVDAAF